MPAMSASAVAREIGTDPKTFRRFVRAFVRANDGVVGVDTPGRGRRYAFDASEIETIRRRFNEWNTTTNGVLVSFGADDDAIDDDDDA